MQLTSLGKLNGNCFVYTASVCDKFLHHKLVNILSKVSGLYKRRSFVHFNIQVPVDTCHLVLRESECKVLQACLVTPCGLQCHKKGMNDGGIVY